MKNSGIRVEQTTRTNLSETGNPASRAQSLSAQWCSFAEELETADVSTRQESELQSRENHVEFDDADFSLGIAFACTAQAPISGIGW